MSIEEKDRDSWGFPNTWEYVKISFHSSDYATLDVLDKNRKKLRSLGTHPHALRDRFNILWTMQMLLN